MSIVETSIDQMALRFERLPSATVFDVMDRLGLGDRCCVEHGIKPLRPGRRLAGPAFTVRWSADPRTPAEWRPEGLDRVSSYFTPIKPGSIVVVDGGGDRLCGHWGEMMSIMAWRSGARGVVVDGGTRDSEGIMRIESWLAFARYTTPIESMTRNRIQAIDVPLLLRGTLSSQVPVRPGDWILADDDAILVIPAEHVPAILEESEALEDLEKKSRAELLAGEDIDEVFRRYGRA